MSPQTHAHLIRVIASMASDVHDSWTLVEHIEMAVPEEARPEVTEVIANWLGFRHSGYPDPTSWLDHQHSVMGASHDSLLRDLRLLAQEDDPRTEDDEFYVNTIGWGYARKRNRDATLYRTQDPSQDPRLLINNPDILAMIEMGQGRREHS